jgi:hypothetical protein
MAYLMKLLFPNTLDKYKDDFSLKIIDQKPIILKNIDNIINKIINNNNEDDNSDYSLAAHHCFIYNDEIEGEILHEFYGNQIFKLNVEQSKGLEFEVVIVYNFFSSSKFQNLWNKMFEKLEGGVDKTINNSNKAQLLTILSQENINLLIQTLNLKCIYTNLDEETIKEKIVNELNDFVYPLDLNDVYDKHDIFEFCSEIKQFYVIITRAKTFLVFYENNLDYNRREFYNFMKSEKIKLIEEFNSAEEFLIKVLDYFYKLNLNVKSKKDLRKMGNDELIKEIIQELNIYIQWQIMKFYVALVMFMKLIKIYKKIILMIQIYKIYLHQN